MKTRFVDFVAIFVVALSCLFWITLVTLGMVYLLGICGDNAKNLFLGLTALSALVISLMVREFQQAIEIPGYDERVDDEIPAPLTKRKEVKRSLIYRPKPAFIRVPSKI